MLHPRGHTRVSALSLAGALLLCALPVAARVSIFGPKVYTISGAKHQVVTNTFSASSACDLDPRAVWTLLVRNGTDSGSGRVSSGTISLNGTVIVAQNDFNQNVASISRSIRLQATNTISVELTGGKDDGSITLSIERHIDLTAPVIDETKYVTTGAKSDSFRQTFNAPTAGGSYTLLLKNGDGSASSMVPGGSVTLNGVEVVSKQELKSGAALSKDVTLAAANDLGITLAGDHPGEFVSLRIVQHVADTTGPVVLLANLQDGQTVSTNPLTVSGTVSDPSGLAALSLGGRSLTISGGTFSTQLTLVPGSNRIAIDAADCEGNTSHRELVLQLSVGPLVAITSPANGVTTSQRSVPVTGTASADRGLATVVVNGQSAVVNGASWSATITLPPGDGTKPITAVATDVEGHTATAGVNVTLDTTPPPITLAREPEAQTWYGGVFIAGWAQDALSPLASVTCNGTAATLGDEGLFNCSLDYQPGLNTIQIVARDAAGNASTLTRGVTYTPDHDQPTISYTLDPPPAASGWIRNGTTLSFACADATSGVLSCPQPFFVARTGRGIVVKPSVTDRAFNRTEIAITLNIDGNGPKVTAVKPAPLVNTPTFTVTGTAHDDESGVAGVTCDGLPATLNGDHFTCTATARPFGNMVRVVATDVAGNTSQDQFVVTLDTTPPALSLDAPSDGTTVNAASITVSGRATDEHGVGSVTINGVAAPLLSDGTFTAVVALQDGPNTIRVVATDTVGNPVTATRTLSRFSVPAVAITSPADFAVVSSSTITVSGTVSANTTSVAVNGVAASISAGRFTAASVPLQQGRTVVTAVARDASGRQAGTTIQVYRDSIPPRVTVVWPPENATVGQSDITVSGNVDDIVIGTINAGQVRVTVNGTAATVANRSFALPVTLRKGANTLTIGATDQAGNTTSVALHVNLSTSQSRLVAFSGANQKATIGARLPAPIVAQLLNAAGQPVAGVAVNFAITANDGTLTGTQRIGRQVVETTNAQGQASVAWTLGKRAGSGNQRVEVTAAGATATDFVATATTGAANLLVVDSGNGQFGATSAPLARPLVAVVVDAGFNRLSGIPVTFAVSDGSGSFDGAPSTTVTSDSDGRAIARPTLGPTAGNDNNEFTATIAGSTSTAIFTASGRVAGNPAATAIDGVVLDNTDTPVPGVSVRIDGTSLVTQTNGQGQFRLAGVPVGYVKLFFDGSTATRSGTWPTLEFNLYTIAGQENPVGMPVYLLPIDLRRGIHVDDVTGGTLTLPELPGFSLTVKPGSATFPGGGRTGTVSATLVHLDKVPMTPSFGQQPRFIVTIQPPGTHFEPPAPVTFPNVEALPIGSVTELYSFDHDLGQFVSIGTGTVSADGSTVISDPGAGIIKGGWHSFGNPSPTGNTGSLTVDLRGHFHDFDPNADTTAAPPKKVSASVERKVAGNDASSSGIDDVAVGASYDFIAAGKGPESCQYTNWEIIDDPDDPNDDPSCGYFTGTPSCPGGTECTATVVGTKAGVLSARVTYQSDATKKKTTSKIVKVRFVKVTMSIKSVTFKVAGGTEMIKVYKDVRTPTPSASEITAPQWTAGDAAAGVDPKSDPLLYVRGKKMSVDLEVKVETLEPSGGAHNLLLEGNVAGLGKFKKKGITLPDAGQTTTINGIDMDTALPNTTRHYDDLSIYWQYKLGSNTPFDLGLSPTTHHEVFVSFAPPVANRKLYLTSVKLALGNGQNDTAQSVFQQTWSAFAARNIKTWDNTPIKYYGQPYSSSLSCTVGNDESGILEVADTSSGQCSGIAVLLMGSLAVNGFGSDRVIVQRTDGAYFLVKKWTFGKGTLNINDPSGKLTPFKWRLDLGGNTLSLDPPPHGNATDYGELTNDLSGLNGQNSSPPKEKLFVNHIFVLPHLADANGSPIPLNPPYYDPSYGVTYSGLSGFVNDAVAGIVAPPVGLVPKNPNAKLARPVGNNDVAAFQICVDDGTSNCVVPAP